MEYTIRQYNPAEDYPLIASWWVSRTGIAPPEDIIPDTSLIAQRNGVDLAATFSYYSVDGSCPAGFLGWTVSNPEASLLGYTHKAVRFVVQEMIKQMRVAGVKYALATTDVSALAEAYQGAGMRPGSRGTLTDYLVKL